MKINLVRDPVTGEVLRGDAADSSPRSGQQDNLCAEPVVGAMEPAPPNSLPTWDECALILDNDNFRKRAEQGLEGSVLWTPPTTPKPTALHRFIYDYDDADPYRSAWFMHRLETMLNETTASQLSELQADAERMREALERIATRCPTESPVYALGSIGDAARAALKGTK